MADGDARTGCRLARSMAARAAPLGRRVRADVVAQQTFALLRGLSSSEEFGTPPEQSLLHHQREGVRWLLAMRRAVGAPALRKGMPSADSDDTAAPLSVGGAVLADEMGLGKTVQVIAFFTALAAHGYFGTHLVVAPLSTLDGWERELQRWSPWLHLTRFHGPADARERHRRQLRGRHRRAFTRVGELRAVWGGGSSGSVPPLSRGRAAQAAERARRVATVSATVGGVVLASYEMVMADRGALARLLHWDTVVVDEGQRLKCLQSRLLAQLQKAHTDFRVVLTGTPVQNNPQELWTLLEYVAPQHFEAGAASAQAAVRAVMAEWTRRQKPSGTKDRRDSPLAENHSQPDDSWEEGGEPTDPSGRGPTDEKESASGGSSTGAEDGATENVSNCLRATVNDLHTALTALLLRRTKLSAGLSLPPKVSVVLPTPLTQMQEALYDAVQREDCFGNNRLMHLRRCCLDPTPLLEQLLLRARRGSVTEPTTGILNRVRCQLKKSDNALVSLSGKFRVLDQMLPVLQRDGHRVLLFSQFTSVLDAVEAYLTAARPEYLFLRLDGSSTAAERSDATAQFRGTPPAKRRPPEHGLDTIAHMGNVECGIQEDNGVFDTPERSHRRAGKRQREDPLDPSPSDRPPLQALGVNRTQEPTCSASSTAYKRLVKDCGVGGDRQPPRTPATGMPSECASGCGVELHSSGDSSPGSRPSKPFLFLISTRTGGAGLNLTGADTVILFDGDFNPHNDRQAIDRSHRIGQTRPVAVYRLLCPGTVEEQLLEAAQRKLLLERAVLTGKVAPAPTVEEELDAMLVPIVTAAAGSGAAPPGAVRVKKGRKTVSGPPLKRRELQQPPCCADEVRLRALAACVVPSAESTHHLQALTSGQLARLLDRDWLVRAADEAHRTV